MGTRADFYVGKGRNAEWIGSLTHDGYTERFPKDFWKIAKEKDYRIIVNEFITENEEVGILPENGWPWPWKSSDITDCSYYFIEGQVLYLSKRYKWKSPPWKKYGRFFSLNTLKGNITNPIYLRETDEGNYDHAAYNLIGCGGLHYPSNVGNAGFMILGC